jgi:hypothetical protein
MLGRVIRLKKVRIKWLQARDLGARKPSAAYFQFQLIPNAKPRALLEFFAYLVEMSRMKNRLHSGDFKFDEEKHD